MSSQNRIINFLTIVLVSSFFFCDYLSFGSYIIAAISFVIFTIVGIINGGKIRFKWNPMFGFMLLFATFSLISSIWAQDITYSIQQFVTIVEITICIYILFLYYGYYDSFNDLCLILLITSLVVSLYCVIDCGFFTILQSIGEGQRIVLSFTNINMVALLDSYGVLVIVYNGIYCNLKKYYFALPLLLMVILAAETRKSIIALMIGLTVLYYFNHNTHDFINNSLRLLSIIAIVFVVYKVLSTIDIFTPIATRIEIAIHAFTGNGYVDNSTRQRSEMITIGINQFKMTPILGMGVGNPRLLLAGLWGKNYPYLHNNYIELLAGGGLVGTIIYYSNYLYVACNLYRVKGKDWDGKYLLLTMLMIQLVLDYMMVSYYSKITYFYFFILYIGLAKLNSLKD